MNDGNSSEEELLDPDIFYADLSDSESDDEVNEEKFNQSIPKAKTDLSSVQHNKNDIKQILERRKLEEDAFNLSSGNISALDLLDEERENIENINEGMEKLLSNGECATEISIDGIEIIKPENMFKIFSPTELTLHSCGYIMEQSLTHYEQSLLKVPPIVLNRKLSSFLVLSEPKSITNHRAFMCFLLKNIAVNPHPVSVSASAKAILELLASGNSEFHSSIFCNDIKDVLLNFGADVTLHCPLEHLPDYLRMKSSYTWQSTPNVHSDMWLYNLENVLTVISKFLEYCKFPFSEMRDMILLLIWISLDKRLIYNMTILIKSCIDNGLKQMTSSSWLNDLSESVAEYLFNINSSIKHEVAVHCLKLIPLYSVRGKCFQRMLSFKLIRRLCHNENIASLPPNQISTLVAILEDIKSRLKELMKLQNFGLRGLSALVHIVDCCIGYNLEKDAALKYDRLNSLLQGISSQLDKFDRYSALTEHAVRVICRVKSLKPPSVYSVVNYEDAEICVEAEADSPVKPLPVETPPPALELEFEAEAEPPSEPVEVGGDEEMRTMPHLAVQGSDEMHLNQDTVDDDVPMDIETEECSTPNDAKSDVKQFGTNSNDVDQSSLSLSQSACDGESPIEHGPKADIQTPGKSVQCDIEDCENIMDFEEPKLPNEPSAIDADRAPLQDNESSRLAAGDVTKLGDINAAGEEETLTTFDDEDTCNFDKLIARVNACSKEISSLGNDENYQSAESSKVTSTAVDRKLIKSNKIIANNSPTIINVGPIKKECENEPKGSSCTIKKFESHNDYSRDVDCDNFTQQAFVNYDTPTENFQSCNIVEAHRAGPLPNEIRSTGHKLGSHVTKSISSPTLPQSAYQMQTASSTETYSFQKPYHSTDILPSTIRETNTATVQPTNPARTYKSENTVVEHTTPVPHENDNSLPSASTIVHNSSGVTTNPSNYDYCLSQHGSKVALTLGDNLTSLLQNPANKLVFSNRSGVNLSIQFPQPVSGTTQIQGQVDAPILHTALESGSSMSSSECTSQNHASGVPTEIASNIAVAVPNTIAGTASSYARNDKDSNNLHPHLKIASDLVQTQAQSVSVSSHQVTPTSNDVVDCATSVALNTVAGATVSHTVKAKEVSNLHPQLEIASNSIQTEAQSVPVTPCQVSPIVPDCVSSIHTGKNKFSNLSATISPLNSSSNISSQNELYASTPKSALKELLLNPRQICPENLDVTSTITTTETTHVSRVEKDDNLSSEMQIAEKLDQNSIIEYDGAAATPLQSNRDMSSNHPVAVSIPKSESNNSQLNELCSSLSEASLEKLAYMHGASMPANSNDATAGTLFPHPAKNVQFSSFLPNFQTNGSSSQSTDLKLGGVSITFPTSPKKSSKAIISPEKDDVIIVEELCSSTSKGHTESTSRRSRFINFDSTEFPPRVKGKNNTRNEISYPSQNRNSSLLTLGEPSVNTSNVAVDSTRSPQSPNVPLKENYSIGIHYSKKKDFDMKSTPQSASMPSSSAVHNSGRNTAKTITPHQPSKIKDKKYFLTGESNVVTASDLHRLHNEIIGTAQPKSKKQPPNVECVVLSDSDGDSDDCVVVHEACKLITLD